jgi:MscS family membrane protein
VRYETTADQLRNIVDLANQRLRQHPQVLDQVDYPRVLIVNFGESSIDIEVRARLSTHELFDFQVVQQDLLLVVLDVVESAGSGMAFPSTTMYIAQDEGLGEQARSDSLDPGVS